MYRNPEIPQTYNKIAEISDNYIVWTDRSELVSGTNYTVYIQYLKPSWLVVLNSNYQITCGTDTDIVAHYNTNGMYSYIDYYDVEYTLQTRTVDEDIFTDNDFDRADMPEIFICQFICVVIVVWVLNQLSKLLHKGGVFGG